MGDPRGSADRSHLVPKQITDRNGHKRTVMINPQARGTVDDAGEQVSGLKAYDHPANLKGGVNTHGHADDSRWGKVAAVAETGTPKEIAAAVKDAARGHVADARQQGRDPAHAAAAAVLVADKGPKVQRAVSRALQGIGRGYAESVGWRVSGSEVTAAVADALRDKDRQQVMDVLSRSLFDDLHPSRDAHDFDAVVKYDMPDVVEACGGDKELAARVVADYRGRVLASPVAVAVG